MTRHTGDSTTLLAAIVTPGVGQGAGFIGLDWVRAAIRQSLGFDPYPGTLNLRLVDGDALDRWRGIRKHGGKLLALPPTERCGGRLIPVSVTPGIAAAVIIPDVTRHGDDVLEVVAAVHLRSRLGLRDDDLLVLTHLEAAGG